MPDESKMGREIAGPRRTCVGCRRRDSPEGWQRVAAGPDGTLRAGRHAPGRGAWFCSQACLEEAIRRGALARALRRSLTSAELDGLRARLCN